MNPEVHLKGKMNILEWIKNGIDAILEKDNNVDSLPGYGSLNEWVQDPQDILLVDFVVDKNLTCSCTSLEWPVVFYIYPKNISSSDQRIAGISELAESRASVLLICIEVVPELG